jgi:HEAT repeat protein
MAATTALADVGTADAKALLGGIKDRGADIQQSAGALSRSAKGLRDDVQSAARDTQLQLRLAAAETLDQAEQRGQQLAADTAASTQEAVRQATAQFEMAADSAAQRAREVQQLLESLGEADLPEAARREAAAALERLAMDANVGVRVQAARAMGQLADPAYLPALMAMLSDESDVQLAVMASLVAIAGTDVAARQGGEPLSNEDRVRMWQVWYRDRQNSVK